MILQIWIKTFFPFYLCFNLMGILSVAMWCSCWYTKFVIEAVKVQSPMADSHSFQVFDNQINKQDATMYRSFVESLCAHFIDLCSPSQQSSIRSKILLFPCLQYLFHNSARKLLLAATCFLSCVTANR